MSLAQEMRELAKEKEFCVMRDSLKEQLQWIKTEAENGMYASCLHFDGDTFSFDKVREFFEKEEFNVTGWRRQGEDFTLNISWEK